MRQSECEQERSEHRRARPVLLTAKRVVVEGGFAHEIAWQAATEPARLTAAVFLREAAWVVLWTSYARRSQRGLASLCQ